MPESDALPALDELLSDYDGSPDSIKHVEAGLEALSGLPGPRANLAVASAFAATAPRGLIESLSESDTEFARMCAVIGLGRLWAEADDAEAPHWAEQVKSQARHPLWRVREAAAMALQLLGDNRPDRLQAAVGEWVIRDPYVVRAAVAGICEPRLLKGNAIAGAALAACGSATRIFVAIPHEDRRADDAMALRKALGYCWSVAVAAAPEVGLPYFDEFDASDPDVAWIMRENNKKARLRRLRSPQS